MAKRFTKAALVEQLRDLADNVQQTRHFDGGNGTAQLRPRGCDEATQALIDKAVDYGRWRTLHNLAADVECGCIGVA
jgi:hypothetical protein